MHKKLNTSSPRKITPGARKRMEKQKSVSSDDSDIDWDMNIVDKHNINFASEIVSSPSTSPVSTSTFYHYHASTQAVKNEQTNAMRRHQKRDGDCMDYDSVKRPDFTIHPPLKRQRKDD